MTIHIGSTHSGRTADGNFLFFLSQCYSQKCDRDMGTFASLQHPELEMPKEGHVQIVGMIEKLRPRGQRQLGVGVASIPEKVAVSRLCDLRLVKEPLCACANGANNPSPS